MAAIAPIAQQIWDMKYRYRSGDGQPVDHSIEATWRRVADALAAPEADRSLWSERFFQALEHFQFIPAGRILAGAGTSRSVTLFNCFVMGEIPDDMGGIFAHLREAALTMQQGGGIGYDFSTLRPKGAHVAGVGADASGPLSFMDVWDSMCRTIMSAGARRGAMMATLRCDHPDVEAFVEAKRDANRLRMFNLSVLISDAFMQAVESDAAWPLSFDGEVYKTVSARGLWDRIMRATYDTAEPGVIFIDRVNQWNNLWYTEQITATNPCGEQPLPPYGNCLLGSINLAALVGNPFTPDAALDLDRLTALVPIAVRMMDNVIEVSRFPLPQQAEEARKKRRIGLGVTGLADALIQCCVPYGSPEAVTLTETWLKAVLRAAYLGSTALAREKGSFPLFDREKYLQGRFIRSLDPDIRAEIAEHGIRNALITSIAPTGTISLLADNVSSGIEPVFAFSFNRAVRQADGTTRTERVDDQARRLFHQLFGDATPLPEYFVDAQSLPPDAHLIIQAAAQKYIDSSISKTINCPESLSFEAFKDVYSQAYQLGCKGCTTYRPNPISGAVLSVTQESDTPNRLTSQADPSESPTDLDRDPGKAAPSDPEKSPVMRPMPRPEALVGETYKVRWPDSSHALYITINDIVDDGLRRPFEVFINSKSMEHYAWTVALTLMISAVFRRGGDVSFVVDELKTVFDPRGGHWMAGRYVPSLMAAIGEVIERHMIRIGFLSPERSGETAFARPDPEMDGDAAINETGPSRGRERCPKCRAPTLIRQEGCDLCLTCGYSRCS